MVQRKTLTPPIASSRRLNANRVACCCLIIQTMFNEQSAERPEFQMHRFLTDAIGHFLASYAACLAVYMIDNSSHTPSKFSHVMALGLAASFSLVDFVIAKGLGNSRWFGLYSLALASFGGYTLFAVVQILFYLITEGTQDLGDSILGWVLISPIFLVPAISFPLVIRLMAYPIIWVLQDETVTSVSLD